MAFSSFCQVTPKITFSENVPHCHPSALPRVILTDPSSTSPCEMVSVSRPTQAPNRLCMSGRMELAAVV